LSVPIDGVGVVALVAGAEEWRLERGSRNVPYLLVSGNTIGVLVFDKRLLASEGKRKEVSVAGMTLLSSVPVDV